MQIVSGKISLQEIFGLYWGKYKKWYSGKIRDVVNENVTKMLKCRTPMLGYHMYKCKKCDNVRLIPHSCKSRFCNSCGKIMTDKWTSERLTDVLQVDYHHLVFTVPWQLRSITLANPKIMINLMFKSVSEALQSWTKQYGGYIPGIYVIVHTFGSDLKYHPHFHVIRPYGLFSSRLKEKLLPLTKQILKQQSKKLIYPFWRERTKKRESKDPLICELCNIESFISSSLLQRYYQT